jgi:hypothetical protein
VIVSEARKLPGSTGWQWKSFTGVASDASRDAWKYVLSSPFALKMLKTSIAKVTVLYL